MKTYVVTGELGKGVNKDKQVLYAGDGQEKASKFTPDEHYHTLHLQTWIRGMLVIQKIRTTNEEWNLTFNMIEDLDKSIQDKRKELEKEEALNEELRTILGQG